MEIHCFGELILEQSIFGKDIVEREIIILKKKIISPKLNQQTNTHVLAQTRSFLNVFLELVQAYRVMTTNYFLQKLSELLVTVITFLTNFFSSS